MVFLKFLTKYYCKSHPTLLTYDSECGTTRSYKNNYTYQGGKR